ncbi:hypothetical protein, partial [Streptomyces sp. NPDC051776]|uniref:hypothetical protein n=1 Tax=Streptomyces sp. NPDC051776 TaxID=3155414 RepID=UPI003434FF22
IDLTSVLGDTLGAWTGNTAAPRPASPATADDIRSWRRDCLDNVRDKIFSRLSYIRQNVFKTDNVFIPQQLRIYF